MNYQVLGRIPSENDDHIRKYPYKLSTSPNGPTPVVVGVNWYENFDNPLWDEKENKWWIGIGNLGCIRGGHSVCIPYDPKKDLKSWYKWYNQLAEGKCVGEASSRAMSHLNRKKYDPTWIWNEAKKIDEWTETNPGDDNGTSVRAAMDVLRSLGHVRKGKTTPSIEDGIAANRWATSIDDLFSVLQNPEYNKLGALPFHNSWGNGYPQTVWMPCEIWDRLLKEDGEMTMITDL